MKIACIGNMNNMMFPICLYLLDDGHDVTLFLLDEYEHFMPTKELIPKKISIIKLGWNEQTYKEIKASDIRKCFEGYEFFIGTDYAPAYLSKAGIVMDIFMPAGSDLFEWPLKRFNYFPPKVWEIDKIKCSMSQYFGIRNAKNFSLDLTNDTIEMLVKSMKIKGNRMPVLPFFYFSENHELLQLRLEKTISRKSLGIADNAFIIFQHGRQAWCYSEDNIHHKGNDILILGIKQFVDSVEQTRPVVLLLLEYGEHVSQSKNLIQELGLNEYVIWIKQMPRDNLINSLSIADVGVGNLKRSWLSYGAVYEFLANKVAFLGYRKDEDFAQIHSNLYPMINASTPEQVAQKLEYYYHNRDELKEMGEQGSKWLLKYAINPSVNAVLEIVKNHSGREKLPMDWKLFFMQPYFLFIKIYNFFIIKMSKK